MRVLAAMSGGVDSAVAAARAVDAGHDVVGVHMALSRNRDQFRTGSRGCCSLEDAGDARRAADVLGIPYYVWDLSQRFEDTVVADFLAEYSAGRTPNPCVRCNEHIKFEALLDKAVALGFDAVCTGHYARIVDRADGVRELHRAADAAKDQSYVLAVMGSDRLARSMFPLGDVASKEDVRADAAARGLGVSAKPDSYDICFVADGNTSGFLREHLGAQPGDIVDADGRVVGAHDGAYAYTVGQRKGLAIGRPAADGKPRYVLEVQPVTNRVVVGSAADLAVGAILADDAGWLAAAAAEPPPPVASAVSGATGPRNADAVGFGSGWVECSAQVRAHGAAVAARARVLAGRRIRIEIGAGSPGSPGLRGVAPGQSVVLYDGTRVLGQATVSSTERAATTTGARA